MEEDVTAEAALTEIGLSCQEWTVVLPEVREAKLAAAYGADRVAAIAGRIDVACAVTRPDDTTPPTTTTTTTTTSTTASPSSGPSVATMALVVAGMGAIGWFVGQAINPRRR